ncbi:MAG: hypothetical protein M3Q10_01945 [Chloroflexota bacterium]|nr:hypothetical protein [Chloroflexota bacterium]
MADARAHRNISVSVPVDLAEELDRWRAEDGTSRSGLVTKLLDEERRRRFEAELGLAYREATEESFFDDIEVYLPARAEVVLSEWWEWEPEAR